MNTSTKWISDSAWTCPRHLPMQRFPANLEQCWYCRAARPDPAGRKVSAVRTEKVDPTKVGPRRATSLKDKCAWDTCWNKRSEKSMYCSRGCSNKNARARFKRSHGEGEAGGEDLSTASRVRVFEPDFNFGDPE